MTDVTNTQSFEAEPQLGDYYALLKPRVMQLVVFTAVVGMLAAPVSVNPVVGFASILFLAIGAGASGALNMWWDADIDAVMKRTLKRPIPAGKVTPQAALYIGVALSGLSVMMLSLSANLLAGFMLAFTIFFYVVPYSMWLKRSTPQNIVIGGAAGAFPPVIGWIIATGSFALEPWLMFALIFMDAAPLLGAGAVHAQRLRRRKCADADRDTWSPCDPQSHPGLYSGAVCAGRGHCLQRHRGLDLSGNGFGVEYIVPERCL